MLTDNDFRDLSDECKTSIYNLSDEILLDIFDYLDGRNLKSCILVEKRLNETFLMSNK